MRSILIASLLSLTAWAQPVLTPADQEFVSTVANGGLAEVELGRLAMKLGLNKEVREFGARLVADGQKANKELQRVVTPYAVVLPAKTDQGHQRQVDLLASLMGVEFDSSFSKQVLAAHQKELKLFETQVQEGQSVALKTLAKTELLTIRAHLEIAKELARPRITSL